jgi:plasmid stability protein
VSKTIQIRDIDDEVYAGLRRRAAEEGVSVPELLRAEATRLAARPSIATWLASTRRRSSALGAEDVIGALDELRDAGR